MLLKKTEEIPQHSSLSVLNPTCADVFLNKEKFLCYTRLFSELRFKRFVHISYQLFENLNLHCSASPRILLAYCSCRIVFQFRTQQANGSNHASVQVCPVKNKDQLQINR